MNCPLSKQMDQMEDEEEEDWADTSWSVPVEVLPVKNGSESLESGVASAATTSTLTELPPMGAGDKLMSRMTLNDNKAGMDGLDKERINQIILEASKGSNFYENELKKERQVKKRIEEQARKLQKLTPLQEEQGQHEADRILQELEDTRDLSHTIVHIDMDAFYAAAETRENPALKDKPMAVGSPGMLSTSNYAARKYGVRAAMPGFIGKKLCPELLIVPPSYDLYRIISEQVREILAEYDPNFCPMSLDEAYLDLTEHIEKRKNFVEEERTFLKTSRSDEFCICDAEDKVVKVCDKGNSGALNPSNGSQNPITNAISKSSMRPDESCMPDGKASRSGTPMDITTDVDICGACGKTRQHTVERVIFGKSIEEAVREIRFRIEQKTRLTASAGIAPNMMLAKICSDKNKPNGQFRVMPWKKEVQEFIQDMPIRKVSGIGKVSESMLKALGIVKCCELYEQRGLLYHLYSPISFNYFLRICLGIGSTQVERDGQRKSLSTERTFNEVSKPAELHKKCYELCEALSHDLKEEELLGKTVTLKLKTVKFEVKTRAQSLLSYTNDLNPIYTAARDLLKVEITACAPQPLRLRLMGVRMSNFLCRSQIAGGKQQGTIDSLLKKMTNPGKAESVTKAITPIPTHLEAPSVTEELNVKENTNTDISCFPAEENLDNSSVPKSDITTLTETQEVPLMNKERPVESEPCRRVESDIGEEKQPAVPILNETCYNEMGEIDEYCTQAEEKLYNLRSRRSESSLLLESVTSETDANSSSVARASGSSSKKQTFVCPVCNCAIKQRRRGDVNKHIDKCLLDQNKTSVDSCPNPEQILGSKNSPRSETNRSISDSSSTRQSKNDSCAHESNNFESRSHGRTEIEKSSNVSESTADTNTTSCISNDPSQDGDSYEKAMSATTEKHIEKPIALTVANDVPQQEQASVGTEPKTGITVTVPQNGITGTVSQTGSRRTVSQTSSNDNFLEEIPCSQSFICPVCNFEKNNMDLNSFNQHVDSCLNRGAIKEILKEQRLSSAATPKTGMKRSQLESSQPSSKRKKVAPSGSKTIDSFFRGSL